jgi:hypothetical protein
MPNWRYFLNILIDYSREIFPKYINLSRSIYKEVDQYIKNKYIVLLPSGVVLLLFFSGRIRGIVSGVGGYSLLDLKEEFIMVVLDLKRKFNNVVLDMILGVWYIPWLLVKKKESNTASSDDFICFAGYI